MAGTITTASVNISCVEAKSGCVVHSHSDDSFSAAGDKMRLPIGKQIDVVHLHQARPLDWA
jgi:hypothetical protein